jgi:2-phospho-L-lactate/phosphoenolpyruvate guanylyltransferase
MSVFAILPIKSFTDAKQRLARELRPQPRRTLAEAMFSDVLDALRRARSIDQILVVTGDHDAERIAGDCGATVLGDDQRGHNAAAARGIERAVELGARRVLLVPGDCPLMAPEELDELIGRRPRPPSAVIIPDRHGTGTNGLLLAPPDALTPTFGPGSCERHAEHARAQGAVPEVIAVPSLALDIDTPEDLVALGTRLESRHGGAAHTRRMLRQLHRGGNG